MIVGHREKAAMKECGDRFAVVTKLIPDYPSYEPYFYEDVELLLDICRFVSVFLVFLSLHFSCSGYFRWTITWR